jgi:hypothetical protein
MRVCVCAYLVLQQVVSFFHLVQFPHPFCAELRERVGVVVALPGLYPSIMSVCTPQHTT